MIGAGLVRLWQFAKRAGEKAGVPAATRRRHVPGAEALVDCELIVPGLKSRPISEASFSQVRKVVWSPLKIAPTIFPLFKLYAFGRGGYANYFQLSGCLFSLG